MTYEYIRVTYTDDIQLHTSDIEVNMNDIRISRKIISNSTLYIAFEAFRS